MEMTINETNKYIFSHFSSDADVISFGDTVKSEYRGILNSHFTFISYTNLGTHPRDISIENARVDRQIDISTFARM